MSKRESELPVGLPIGGNVKLPLWFGGGEVGEPVQKKSEGKVN